MEHHIVESELWAEHAESTTSWVFLTVPVDVSRAIRDRPRPPARGFGTIRVRATIGDFSWATSLFPDAKSGCYFLPVKKEVRRAESLATGDRVTVRLEILQ